jgi:hypothetical protein
MAATLLTRGERHRYCPFLSDVEAACNILEFWAAGWRETTRRSGGRRDAGCSDIPEYLMGVMRSSFLFFRFDSGPLRPGAHFLSRGCELGRGR